MVAAVLKRVTVLVVKGMLVVVKMELVTGIKVVVTVLVEVGTLKQEHAADRRVAGVLDVTQAGAGTVPANRFLR